MDSGSQDGDIERITLAIQKLLQEKKNNQAFGVEGNEEGDDCDHLLLSKLLSQLEALKGDAGRDQAEAVTRPEQTEDGYVGPKIEKVIQAGVSKNETEAEEIAKEIKKVKKQNSITHCLLSVMIILTVTWQLSEVSLLLAVKDRVSHPFRSVGSMISGMFRKPARNGEDAEKESSSTLNQTEASSLPHLKMPDLPHMDMPELGFNGDKQ